MLKRVIAVICVLTFVCSMFIGCGKGSDTAGNQATAAAGTLEKTQETKEQAPDYGDTGGLKLPLVDKPTTISCVVDCPYPNRSDSIIMKELEKRTGIKVQVQELPTANLAEKVKVMLASGKPTDIVYSLDMRGRFSKISQLSMLI